MKLLPWAIVGLIAGFIVGRFVERYHSSIIFDFLLGYRALLHFFPAGIFIPHWK